MEPNGTGAPAVADNTAESRYELHVGGELAGFVAYHMRHGSGVINLIHTQFDPKFQGAGLAGQLARGTLDDIRARNLHVLPTCPYIRSWIGKHPDYADLVSSPGSGTEPPADLAEGAAG
jgi:uncharacterized protein